MSIPDVPLPDDPDIKVEGYHGNPSVLVSGRFRRGVTLNAIVLDEDEARSLMNQLSRALEKISRDRRLGCDCPCRR